MPEEERQGLRGWRRLALVTGIATYLLIVLGGAVRITESGMGCGPEWPLCDGHLIPPMDFETLMEYGHRLVAAAVGLLILGLTGWAWKPGRSELWRPLRRLTLAAVVLLVVQMLLGAVTVWYHLPRGTVILHLAAAMGLLALLAVAWCRARDLSADREGRVGGRERSRDRPRTLTWMGVAFGAVVVVAGALVANLGAAPACQGFPLCNDAWLPADNPLVQIHWGHRMLAYGFALWAFALPWVTARWRPDDPAARAAAWTVAGLTLLQLGVAASLVLQGLPEVLQVLHLAVGGAIFAALVIHGWSVAHPFRAAPARASEGPARSAVVPGAVPGGVAS